MNSDGRSGGVEEVKRMDHDYPAKVYSRVVFGDIC